MLYKSRCKIKIKFSIKKNFLEEFLKNIFSTMANLQLIKELARQKNISLDSLAKELEITPQAMSIILRTNTTKIATLERIAQILGVSPSVFFDGQQGTVAADHSIAVSGNNCKVNQVDKFLSLLEKKDEQMDRLLGIIETLNNK